MSDLVNKHPKLFHYTTWNGLKGILDSRCIWANHIRYMNDASELTFGQEFIQEELRPIMSREVSSYASSNDAFNAKMEDRGGLEKYLDRVLPLLFKERSDVLGENFYVTSFFGWPEAEPDVQKDGLLSQWRGYGGGTQGYALIFDTEQLEEAFLKESNNGSYGPSLFGDVVYGSEKSSFDPDMCDAYTKLMSYFTELFHHILRNGNEPDLNTGHQTFAYCSSFLKHPAFREEREVRFSFTPLAVDRVASNKIKKVEIRDRSSSLVPYIEIPVPKVEGIIVGPHQHKEANTQALRRLVEGESINVSVSSIPLV